MTSIVYIRMKKKLGTNRRKKIYLGDIAYLSTTFTYKREMEETPLYQITKRDRNIVVIDGFIVIDHLRRRFPDLEFQLIGPEQTIIQIQQTRKTPSAILAGFVWILLFIGAAMTIMNFHYDVS